MRHRGIQWPEYADRCMPGIGADKIDPLTAPFEHLHGEIIAHGWFYGYHVTYGIAGWGFGEFTFGYQKSAEGDPSGEPYLDDEHMGWEFLARCMRELARK